MATGAARAAARSKVEQGAAIEGGTITIGAEAAATGMQLNTTLICNSQKCILRRVKGSRHPRDIAHEFVFKVVLNCVLEITTMARVAVPPSARLHRGRGSSRRCPSAARTTAPSALTASGSLQLGCATTTCALSAQRG